MCFRTVSIPPLEEASESMTFQLRTEMENRERHSGEAETWEGSVHNRECHEHMKLIHEFHLHREAGRP
jgi:hypothetical protein